MDLGITNIFIFYLRSWLILSIEISQPSFDHRLTLAIYFTAQVESVNIKGIENLDRFIPPSSRYIPRFQELNKDFVLLHPFQESHRSLLNPTRTPPRCFFTSHISIVGTILRIFTPCGQGDDCPTTRLYSGLTSWCDFERYWFEHVELPAKLLDYFLRSNKSNINQQGYPLEQNSQINFLAQETHVQRLVCLWNHVCSSSTC